MIINPKTIQLKDGRELTLKSVAPAEAQNFLNHLIITSSESYQNLGRGAEFWKKLSAQEEERILENLEHSMNSFMMGAFFQERIVGGVGIFGMNQEFSLHCASVGMSIQKEFSGKGLGHSMLVHVFEEAKKIGLHRLELTVRTYNHAGIALYEKTGFERIGLLKDAALIDGQYVNEFSYQKIL